jgi:hypothetical protein
MVKMVFQAALAQSRLKAAAAARTLAVVPV